jgi:hypothetical protein
MDIETTVEHKFLEGSNMTFQEVFDFAFNWTPLHWGILA